MIREKHTIPLIILRDNFSLIESNEAASKYVMFIKCDLNYLFFTAASVFSGIDVGFIADLMP